MDLEVGVEEVCGRFRFRGELYVHIVSCMMCIVATNAKIPSIADIGHCKWGQIQCSQLVIELLFGLSSAQRLFISFNKMIQT